MKAKVTPMDEIRPSHYDMNTEKANNIVGSRISEARKRKGYTLASFSEALQHCGVKISKGAASKWETGETVPNAYQLIAICDTLEIPDQFNYFVGNYVSELNEEGLRKVREYKHDLMATGKYAPPAPKKTAKSVIRYIDMKVSTLAVSAGTGEFLDEGNYETISFPENIVPEGADFGVRVSGDSMEPVYHDGQIVWVSICDQVDVGQVGVFIYDGAGYLKVYDEQEPDEDIAEEFTDSYGNVHAQPVMISYNQKYEPRVVSPGVAFQIVGRVL